MKNKKVLILLSVLLLVSVAAYLLVARYYAFFPFTPVKDTNPTSEFIKQRDAKQIDESKDTINKPTTTPESSQVSEEIPLASALSVEITSWKQENRLVESTAKTSSDGMCVFQYTADGDKPVVREVKVENNECKSSIPELYFSKIGAWKLKVVYYNNDQKAEVLRDVTIQ